MAMELPQRFWNKVNKEGPIPITRPELGPCWIWTGSIHKKGYGHFWYRGKYRKAHRVSYRMLVGKFGGKPQIDHLCRVRGCVNPTHLEPVTNRENLLRGRNVNREKTHCSGGHEFTPENTRIASRSGRKGERVCRTCSNAAVSRFSARRAEGVV